MLRIKSSRSLDQRGSNLLEAAIALPFLVLIIGGIIQWGLILTARLNLQDAAAIGARHAALTGQTNTSAQIVAKLALNSWIDSTAVTSLVTDELVSGVGAKKAQMTYNMSLFFPFAVPGAGGGVYTLQAEAFAR